LNYMLTFENISVYGLCLGMEDLICVTVLIVKAIWRSSILLISYSVNIEQYRVNVYVGIQYNVISSNISLNYAHSAHFI